MVERVKTVVLYSLVILSFFLTWSLWYGLPNYEYISPADYEERKSIGHELKMQELIRPTQIIFHRFSDNEHEPFYKVALPSIPSYRYITDSMPKWYFSDSRLSNKDSVYWDQYAMKREGVEVRFDEQIPLSVLKQMFIFRDNEEFYIQGINRVWLVKEDEDGNSIKALLFNDSSNQVIEAKTSVSNGDLTVYGDLGESAYDYERIVLNDSLTGSKDASATEYERYLYLPKAHIHFPQYTWTYNTITPEEMIDILFIDPSSLQEIKERDNSLIYHDGTKGMRVDPLRRYISYMNPPAIPSNTRANPDDKLHAAINFVNQHGGWTKFSYNVQKWPTSSSESEQTLEFTPYYEMFAIYGSESLEMNVRIQLSNDTVTGYDRSLLTLNERKKSGSVEVMSGGDLLEILQQKGVELTQLEDISLVYRPVLNAETSEVSFVLNWAITFNNREQPEFLDARVDQLPSSSEGEEGSHGLE